MVNPPCSFVVAVKSAPVATFFATTLAPGITAPDASVTVPMMEDAVPPWANADVTSTTLISAVVSHARNTQCLIFAPRNRPLAIDSRRLGPA